MCIYEQAFYMWEPLQLTIRWCVNVRTCWHLVQWQYTGWQQEKECSQCRVALEEPRACKALGTARAALPTSVDDGPAGNLPEIVKIRDAVNSPCSNEGLPITSSPVFLQKHDVSCLT